jgi:hypothetical protein
MFKTLTAAVALLAVMASAKAAAPNIQVTGTYGGWSTFTSVGADQTGQTRPMCGAMLLFGGQRSFMIKYQLAAPTPFMHIFKTGWKIPAGQMVDLVFSIDGAPGFRWTGVAVDTGDGLELPLKSKAGVASTVAGDFLDALGSGQQLQVSFPSGNEPPWVSSLSGTDPALHAMLNCMKLVDAAAQPSQPTQPFAAAPAAPTQPFGTQPTMTPAPVSSAFTAGLDDRGRLETWLRTLGDGPLHSGAAYWLSVRSTAQRAGACQPGGQTSLDDFTRGCQAAKQLVDPMDYRRTHEPDYKAGWNSYSGIGA